MWAASAQAAQIVHIVQKGQTLGAIARRYHTTIPQIERTNGLRHGTYIYPGQKLRVSVSAKVAARHRRQKKASRGKSKPTPAPVATRTGRSAKHPIASRKKSGPRAKGTKTRGPRGSAKPKKRPPKARANTKRSPKSGVAKRQHPRRANRGPTKKRSPTTKQTLKSRGKNGKKAGQKKKTKTYARKPKRPGHVNMVRYSERFRGPLVDRKGRLVRKGMKRLKRIMRDLRSKKSRDIHPRLAKLIAKLSDHFGGRTIVVVSGYRAKTPKQYTRESRHNYGKAIDFRVLGVPNPVLRDYCRRFANVGVGYYPNSTFIHLDVRSYRAAWTDYSRPGQKPRYAKKKKVRPPKASPGAKGKPNKKVANAKTKPKAAKTPTRSRRPARVAKKGRGKPPPRRVRKNANDRRTNTKPKPRSAGRSTRGSSHGPRQEAGAPAR